MQSITILQSVLLGFCYVSMVRLLCLIIEHFASYKTSNIVHQGYFIGIYIN